MIDEMYVRVKLIATDKPLGAKPHPYGPNFLTLERGFLPQQLALDSELTRPMGLSVYQ